MRKQHHTHDFTVYWSDPDQQPSDHYRIDHTTQEGNLFALHWADGSAVIVNTDFVRCMIMERSA